MLSNIQAYSMGGDVCVYAYNCKYSIRSLLLSKKYIVIRGEREGYLQIHIHPVMLYN